MASIKKTTHDKCWWDIEKKEHMHTVAGNANWCCLYGKQYESSSKTKNRIALWCSNSTPGYISKESKKKWNNGAGDFHHLFPCSLMPVACEWHPSWQENNRLPLKQLCSSNLSPQGTIWIQVVKLVVINYRKMFVSGKQSSLFLHQITHSGEKLKNMGRPFVVPKPCSTQESSYRSRQPGPQDGVSCTFEREENSWMSN